MAYNGSGQFDLPAGNPVVSGTVISSTWANTTLSQIATGLSTAVLKDGQQTITANLPMAGFKFTGLGAGTAAGNSVRWEQLASSLQAAQWVAAGGTADVITAAYSPVYTALVDGMLLGFRASAANATTTPTFAPDGLTARTITKTGGAALVAGDIPGALAECLIRYNLANTRWELLNVQRSPASTAQQVAGTSNVVMVTPSNQVKNGSATKGSGAFNTVGGVESSYNVAGVTDVGTGKTGITWTTAFNLAAYPVTATPRHDQADATDSLACQVINSNFAVGYAEVWTYRVADYAKEDANYIGVIACGVQA